MKADRLRHFLTLAAEGAVFSEKDSEELFGLVMDGVASEAQIAALLMALRVRGETADELLGAVRAIRARMKVVPDAPEGTIDVCGTGGDGYGTLNVSTAVAFVLAALGVPVAKHGNRALSSRSGASDVLQALGVPLGDDPFVLGAELRERRLVFLAAPHHHPAMRHAAGARKALGVRTLLNFAGPLVNPACVTRQLLGVSSCQWLDRMVNVLQKLGSVRVWAVCGEVPGAEGGDCPGFIDEVTLAGPTHIEVLEDGQRMRLSLTADMAGLKQAPVSAIAGGGPEENAAALEALLSGATGPYRDTVLLNAACALHVAGRAALIKNGQIVPSVLKELVSYASRVLDDGTALEVLRSGRSGSVQQSGEGASR